MQVILIAVISLDGRITPPGKSGPTFASPEDQAWFVSSLQHFDCSVMGRTTYEMIPKEKTAPAQSRRLRVVVTRDPQRYAGMARAGEVEFTNAKPAEILAGLAARGFRRCALLGGGQVYRLFLNAGLVDGMWLTLEPVVLGGGTPLADGPVADRRFHLVQTRHLSADTLLLNYRRTDTVGLPLPAFDPR